MCYLRRWRTATSGVGNYHVIVCEIKSKAVPLHTMQALRGE
jgi:hypothetical protein